jgi:hypothetical protein
MKMLLIYLSAVVISFNLLGVTAVNKFTKHGSKPKMDT